jgi:hypothetical protein
VAASFEAEAIVDATVCTAPSAGAAKMDCSFAPAEAEAIALVAETSVAVIAAGAAAGVISAVGGE